jgi:predicted peptidase
MQTPFSFLAGEEEIRYLVFLPQDFDPAGQWPLILFLHGNNDVGQDISRLADSTLLEFVSDPQDFSFIVISPQLPSGFWPKYIDPIEALLEHLVPLLAIDRSRMYLTGVSAGGYGAWKYILKFPGRFAAAAPIAGPASLSPSSPVPEEVCVLKDLPIRVYHGDADSATPFELNQAMVAALEDCGGNVQFTLIPGGSHADAWITAYSDPGFFDWLLSHQK